MKTKLHGWRWVGCVLLLWASICPVHAFYNPTTGRWLSRDPIGELGGANLLFAIAGNDLVNGIDILGLVDFEFVVIKNETGKNRENQSGEWGSPGSYFTGSESVAPPKSATTTLTGHGPISGHCCNTVVSKKKGMADNGNAGSIFIFMKDADPGTYSVKLGFSGTASISIASGEGKEGNAAQATLEFHGESPVLIGRVSLGRKGPGKSMDWAGSKDTTVTVVIKKKSDRVLIGKYDVTMNLNICPSELTVTATGNVEVKEHNRVK